MGNSRRSPNSPAIEGSRRKSARRSLQWQLENGKWRRTPPQKTSPSPVCSSATTEPYVPVEHKVKSAHSSATSTPPSDSDSLHIVQPSPKKKDEVVNLISQSLPTPSPLGKTSDDVEPLTDIFHCKGVVYSRLPYDTLWESTPLIDEESDGIICSKADWVTVSALLAALSSGTIREDVLIREGFD